MEVYSLAEQYIFFFFFLTFKSICVFGYTGPLLLCGLSLVVAGRGCSLVAVHVLLVVVASLVAEHEL